MAEEFQEIQCIGGLVGKAPYFQPSQRLHFHRLPLTTYLLADRICKEILFDGINIDGLHIG